MWLCLVFVACPLKIAKICLWLFVIYWQKRLTCIGEADIWEIVLYWFFLRMSFAISSVNCWRACAIVAMWGKLSNYFFSGSIGSNNKPIHPKTLFGRFFPQFFDFARGWKVLGDFSLYVRIVAWLCNRLTLTPFRSTLVYKFIQDISTLENTVCVSDKCIRL